MSTMTVPVRSGILTGNGFLKRYFYFAMSLVLAAIVVAGFQRTVNDKPVPSCSAAAVYSVDAWGGFRRVGCFFYFSIDAGAGAQSQLASVDWMVWRRAGRGDGSAGRDDGDRHGAV